MLWAEKNRGPQLYDIKEQDDNSKYMECCHDGFKCICRGFADIALKSRHLVKSVLVMHVE